MLQHIAGAGYSTKNDILYNQLKEQIINGVLRPGERLVVASVAKEFDVSPMPVREAFQRLQQDGLIEITPHVGAKVTAFDMKTFKEIIFIRNELEPLAAKLAATAMTDAQIDALFALTDEMARCAQAQDYHAYTQLNLRFHDGIYAGCGNATLYDLIRSLIAKTEFSKSIFMRDHQRMNTSTADHRHIAECIRARDPEAAYAAFRAHKQKGFEIITEILSHELSE